MCLCACVRVRGWGDLSIGWGLLKRSQALQGRYCPVLGRRPQGGPGVERTGWLGAYCYSRGCLLPGQLPTALCQGWSSRWPGCEEGRQTFQEEGSIGHQSPYVTQKVPRSSSRLTERLVREAASRASLYPKRCMAGPQAACTTWASLKGMLKRHFSNCSEEFFRVE